MPVSLHGALQFLLGGLELSPLDIGIIGIDREGYPLGTDRDDA